MTLFRQRPSTRSEPLGKPSGLAPSVPSQIAGTVVDTHVHLWESLSQLGDQAAQWVRLQTAGEPWDRPDTPGILLDGAMEPVDYAIILGLECRLIGASIPSEQVARYVARQPDKYLGFAGIDPMGPGYQSAVKRAVDLGLVGVTVSPAAAGFHPSDTRAMRLYEQCEQLGLPVMVHPGTHLGAGTKLEYTQPYLYDEVARTFPCLKLVLAGAGVPWADQALILVGKHGNCYVDLSDLSGRPWQLYNVLLMAYQQGVISRLLFGSDFPFTIPETAIHNIYSVNTMAHGTHLPIVPREQLRSIVERNALVCLGLTRPQMAQPQPAAKAVTPSDDRDQLLATKPVEPMHG